MSATEIRVPITIDLVIKLTIKQVGGVPKIKAEVPEQPKQINIPVPPATATRFANRDKKFMEDMQEELNNPIEHVLRDKFPCDFPGCVYVGANEGALGRHRGWHNQNRKKRGINRVRVIEQSTADPAPLTPKEELIDFNKYTPKPVELEVTRAPDPRSEEEKQNEKEEKEKENDKINVLDCPNPDCRYKKRFLKGMGFVANGREWCQRECFDLFMPPGVTRT